MVKTKEETIKINTESKDFSKYASNDLTTLNWTPWPVSDGLIEGLCRDLLLWASDEEIAALRITDFYDGKGMYEDDTCLLRQKWPQLERAHQQAKRMIGSRRERGAILKRYDTGAVRWGQHHYGREWHDYDKHHADLKKIDVIQDKMLNVYFNPHPESDKVQAKLEQIKAKRKKK